VYNLTGNIPVNEALILSENISRSIKSSLYNQVNSIELLQEICGNSNLIKHSCVHKTAHMHVIVNAYGPTDRYMLKDLLYACWKWIPFQSTMGTHLWKCFFLQEKALRVPQFANINSLICNKCYAGLPCLSQFTLEVSSLETNIVSTRWYPGYPCNTNKAAQGTKEECSPGINLQM